MKVKTPVAGMICASAQGRDKGQVYAVVGMAGDSFVLVADGIRRKLDSPKRKNLKHLVLTPHNIGGYGAYLSNGKATDCSLAYALKQYKNSQK